jgi:hypothetical protein
MTILTIFPHCNCKEVGEADPRWSFQKGKVKRFEGGGEGGTWPYIGKRDKGLGY